ncbi:MAG: hypothetical protein M3389_14890, partial [Actinomycetota bacterium]|nr:hypothetical protein [Actinomycetota bacterium]
MPVTLRRPRRLPLAVPALALCLLAALVLAGVPTAPTPATHETAASSPAGTVAPAVQVAADRTPDRRIEVIVQLRPEAHAAQA